MDFSQQISDIVNDKHLVPGQGPDAHDLVIPGQGPEVSVVDSRMDPGQGPDVSVTW